MRRLLRPIVRDRGGATIAEFALIAPVMLLLLMGSCELLYQEYVQSILSGEVQKAARDSGIEGGASNTASIDSKVIARLAPVARGFEQSCPKTAAATATAWCSDRKYYDSFSEVAPEPFTDGNTNGIRDAGECFTDVNGNGTWDADPGTAGQGGASAIATYTMTISYPRLFPLGRMLGWSRYGKISSSTLLKNQPYASQTTIDDAPVCT